FYRCASFQINFVFKIELRKSIGLDEDIVEVMCLVSLVVIKAQKIAPLSLYLCRKDAIIVKQ
ncbi:hypothetical protein, partial [Staphylococcus aureus]|uniref:hypothetical protein n=1 Tax=Staphylococcus aureus TaxID=1280 RepID=UPI001955448E